MILTTILIHSSQTFLKLFPFVFIAVLISALLKRILTRNKIHAKINENTQSEALATITGILTPGPLISYLPILKELKNRGVPYSIIAAFITGQTLIGPVRLFLETGYFGWKFFLVRVVSALLMGITVGLIFRMATKRK